MIRRLMPLVLLVVFALVGCTPAEAQSVTRKTFKAIDEIQELTEQDRIEEAIAKLEELVIATKDNPYDYAIANQYLAHNSVQVDDIPRARRALEEALSSTALPPEMEAELKMFYGSVLLGEDEFEQAVRMLEDWFAVAVIVQPRQIFTVAYANYMAGNVGRAEELIARAVDEAGDAVPDTWYQVYYRILFDLKKYGEGEDLLYDLITRDPSVALHWRLLASHYLQLEESSDALAAIMLSYLNNQVENESDLKQIVSLYGYIDVPEKAARMLEEFLQQGKIQTDPDTQKQLGNLWLLAREREKAKVSLWEAAKASPDGKTYALLGSIYFEDEDWKAAYTAFQQALKLGGLDEPPRISLLAGISAYYAEMFSEAKSALEDAAVSPNYRSQAEGLLKKIDEA